MYSLLTIVSTMLLAYRFTCLDESKLLQRGLRISASHIDIGSSVSLTLLGLCRVASYVIPFCSRPSRALVIIVGAIDAAAEISLYTAFGIAIISVRLLSPTDSLSQPSPAIAIFCFELLRKSSIKSARLRPAPHGTTVM